MLGKTGWNYWNVLAVNGAFSSPLGEIFDRKPEKKWSKKNPQSQQQWCRGKHASPLLFTSPQTKHKFLIPAKPFFSCWAVTLQRTVIFVAFGPDVSLHWRTAFNGCACSLASLCALGFWRPAVCKDTLHIFRYLLSCSAQPRFGAVLWFNRPVRMLVLLTHQVGVFFFHT